ncbi:MAG: flavin reductase family protein, partial [Ferruginibacter sp.]|nr:flavin reductase family protein [Cytophagales bacterium]
PDETSIRAFQSTPDIQSIREQFGNDPAAERHHRHRLAQRYLEAGQVAEAWKVLLGDEKRE